MADISREVMTKKRIVLLTDCLADLAGGAEKQIFELARGLDKNAYEVHVVSLDCYGQASVELIESTGSLLHTFRVVRVYGLSGLIQGLRFFKFLKNNRIDILLTYHFSSDMWGTFWGHLAGVKTIISNRRDMGFWRNGLHIAAYKLMNHWVNKIVTVSASIKDLVIKEEGVAAERIEVIYNGIELDSRFRGNDNRSFGNDNSPFGSDNRHLSQELRNQLERKRNDILIMHVANLKPVKGHYYLLEAFAGVVTQFPDAKLILVGRDELDGQLQNLAQKLNISDKVVFMGKRENVKDLLVLADICVLPSLSEGMSNAILEYMLAGKPVIATNVGGNPELVRHDFNGLLVEKENVQQLKEALLKLLGDKDKRRVLGQNGFSRVKSEFSMKTMLEHYCLMFKDTPRNIKILHLISSGGLFGAERVVLNLASKSNGITSFVGAINNLHNPHLEIIEEAKKLGLKTIIFDSKRKFDFGTVDAIKKFIIENKIDIVHTHNYKADIAAFVATRFTNAKWVVTNHLWHSTDQKLRFYEMIDAFVSKFAQKVVGVSAGIKQDLMRKGLKADRLVVIDNGIPIEKFDHQIRNESRRSSLGIAPADCAVLIVGRLSAEKGHEVFLKAAAQVVKNVQNVKFIIIGDGPLREKLKEQARHLNLSVYVIFTGILEDMPAVYALGDILVNASFAEGLPMTILEAMASRLPVIATDVGAVGEVIKDHVTGILLKPGNDLQLAFNIIELAKSKEKRQRLAQNAYQEVTKHYSDSRMAERYKEIYFSALK